MRANPLRSERLTLRPIDTSDAEELWQVIESSRSSLEPWLPWVPYQQDLESSVRFAEASAVDWDQGRATRFGIRQQPDDQLVGVVGLESCVAMHRSCELGYWLSHGATGKGLMTEAARLCMVFAFKRIGVHRLRVAAATTNHPSLRVIARLGFQFEGVARHAEWCYGRWLDHAVFSVLEQEWIG